MILATGGRYLFGSYCAPVARVELRAVPTVTDHPVGAAAPMRGSVSNGAGEKRARDGAATGAASLPLASCAPAYSIDWPRLRKMRVTGRVPSPRRSHSFAALTLRGGGSGDCGAGNGGADAGNGGDAGTESAGATGTPHTDTGIRMQ